MNRVNNVEEERIRKAYSKRTRDEVLYSWFSAGQLFMIQGRERRLLKLLKRYGFASLKEQKTSRLVAARVIGYVSLSNGERYPKT